MNQTLHRITKILLQEVYLLGKTLLGKTLLGKTMIATRKNLLKQAISYLRIKLGRKIHITKEEKTTTVNTLRLDPDQVIELIEFIEKQANFGNKVSSELPHISLTYGQDLHKRTSEKLVETGGGESNFARMLPKNQIKIYT